MLRPCFLVVDREHSGSISTRKLVIETAKFNVITAYSGAEALEALEKFPRVDGVILDDHVKDVPCVALVGDIKRKYPLLVIISIGRKGCPGSDHHMQSFAPKDLLEMLQKLEPERTAILLARDEALANAE